MKLLQLAVTSIVDANTGYELSYNGNKIDYASAAQHGRAVRSKSIIALYRQIKNQLGSLISSYHERAKRRRQLTTLVQLDDHLLEDIGLSRGDVYALELGQVTLEQLNAQRRNSSRNEILDLTTSLRTGQQGLQLDAVNESVYKESRCA